MAANAEGGTREQKLEPRPVEEEEEEEKVTPTHIISTKQNETKHSYTPSCRRTAPDDPRRFPESARVTHFCTFGFLILIFLRPNFASATPNCFCEIRKKVSVIFDCRDSNPRPRPSGVGTSGQQFSNQTSYHNWVNVVSNNWSHFQSKFTP